MSMQNYLNLLLNKNKTGIGTDPRDVDYFTGAFNTPSVETPSIIPALETSAETPATEIPSAGTTPSSDSFLGTGMSTDTASLIGKGITTAAQAVGAGIDAADESSNAQVKDAREKESLEFQKKLALMQQESSKRSSGLATLGYLSNQRSKAIQQFRNSLYSRM